MTNIKTQGFKEDVDPLLGKARKHMIVANRAKFDKENVSNRSAIVPVPITQQDDVVTLRYENSEEFTEFAGEFEEDNDIELVIRKDGNEILVDIPVENSADFIDFLADNDIKEKEAQEEKEENDSSKVNDAKAAEKVGDIDKKDVPVHPSAKFECSVDKIIADAQGKRSKRAIAIDKLRTAKRVGDKDNAGDLISWLKNPGKTDLKNVDSPDAE